MVSALAGTGLPAARLEIEVTESIFLRDATMARNALERLLALGCGVSLDDFGTGYSSLGYLRKLRFTTIKVDRSFVKGAAVGNAESLAIIRAVVELGLSLGKKVTVEGVETAEQVLTLRGIGHGHLCACSCRFRTAIRGSSCASAGPCCPGDSAAW